MAARDYGLYGGITRALELVGERWALLIVRDLLVGPRRYGELAVELQTPFFDRRSRRICPRLATRRASTQPNCSSGSTAPPWT